MYIKELKINGFKSFADKVNLELNRNFTGIVGPNGSGKSNIVDALKWVMGEQSVKTLRGSNGMTDCIFNGSKTREAARSASVSLVLDNSDKSLPLDYQEIEIKRAVYKTGENEYYLNKEKVRLKDILNLFMDSFSSKESLSIIPQGKISEILDGRPEDRRVIFEDAAGVLKYKKRKEDTLRRLAKTNENLERVNMIIDELELQVVPLEEQAKKAKIYKENKEKLENIEIALLASDIASLNEEYNVSKKEREDLETKLVNTSAIDAKSASDLERMKLKRTELDNEVSKTQRELIESTEKLNSIGAKKELLKERSKYDKNSNQVVEKLNSLKEDRLKLSNSFESLKLQYEADLSKEKEISNKLDGLSASLEKLTKESLSLKNDLGEKTKRSFELVSKKDIISYNIENMSKVPFSVKSVLSNPSLNGIVNTIGSLINVDSIYAESIDTALAGSANFVVTNSDSDAKEAVEYLKRAKKGRVTFFPLNLIKAKYIDDETLNTVSLDPGYVNVASRLIQYDSKYENIIGNVLGNIIVVKNMDDALRISKKINSRYRVVTLEGEIIHVGGSLTGGSKNSSTAVNEKIELDKISKSIKLLEKEIESCEDVLRDKELDLNKVKDDIYVTNLELLKMNESNKMLLLKVEEEKALLDSVIDEINALSNNESGLSSELDKVVNEYYEKEKEKNSLESKMADLERERLSLIEEIEEKENASRVFGAKHKELENKIQSLNLKEAKLNLSLDNCLNRLNEEYGMTFEHARNNYSLEIDIEEARSIISELKRVIKALGEVNLGSIEEYDRINTRFNFLNSQKQDLKTSEENLLNIIRDMDDVMIDKFATTFKKVNVEFSKVFKDLFGGGEAHLEMTDPSNVLQTGIEIVANPAGKNPGALSLLSGGEKTLTAISLLFAILNLKNVPFVILDEVESALDEVNVDKFGKYINSYKGRTQLLVITHKKKTMEYLDLLYGITMQESGVSKLVSVKLEEIKE